LHLDRNVHLVAAIWGVLKIGAVFLPLDTSIPADRLRYMLSQSRARWVISESMAPDAVGDCLPLRPADLLASGHARRAGALGAPAALPQMLAYVIFTSGSTGKPKGVEVTRAGVSAYVEANFEIFPLGSRDVGISVTSIG